MTDQADIQEVIDVVNQAQVSESFDSPQPVDNPYSDNIVDLPVGLLDPMAGSITTAEVRELNGFDEELVARAKDLGAALLVILERATVKIGEEKSTKRLLETLTIGDRMELLIGIRKATWGDALPVNLTCGECGISDDVEVSVTNDIPRNTIDDPIAGREIKIDLPSGSRADLTWPTGVVHTKVLMTPNMSSADMTTALITDCVVSLDGLPLLDGERQAKGMSVRDRAAITKAVTEKLPGPVLDKTEVTCPACGEKNSLPLQVGALFPF